MKRFAVGVATASLAFVFVPRMAAAQCEGGVTVAGHYTPEGAYVPGGCAYTNPTTPGQLYPSGAQPAPSTNPAQGGSRLPGQDQPSDLIPVNSSDLGPAPSLVNGPATRPGPQRVGPSIGPGVPWAPISTVPSTVSATDVAVGNGVAAPATLPGELPPSGAPALTGNRGVPSSEYFPGQTINPTGVNPPANVVAPTGTGAASSTVAPPVSTGSGQPVTVRVRIAETAEPEDAGDTAGADRLPGDPRPRPVDSGAAPVNPPDR